MSNAELIATAKAMREQLGDDYPKPWSILALWLATADALEAAIQERDNWKMSAEEGERAEKRWKDRAHDYSTEHDAKVRAEELREAYADVQAYTDSGAPFGHRPVEEFLLRRADRIEREAGE